MKTKFLTFILCCIIAMSFIPIHSIPAKTVPIKAIDFSLLQDMDENREAIGDAYIKLEAERSFSVLSYLSVEQESTQCGFVEKYAGLSFTSSDETILKLIDKDLGIFESLKPGQVTVTVKYNNSNKISAELKVTVLEKGTLDPKGVTLKIVDEIKKYYNTKITNNTILDFQNKFSKVSEKASKYDLTKEHTIALPEQYLDSLTWNKISDHLDKNKAIYRSYKPFSVKSITPIKKGKIKITLDRKLNDNDLISYASIHEKNSSRNLAMDFRVIFFNGKLQNSKIYDTKILTTMNIKLKSGTQSFTVSLPKAIKSKKVYSATLSIDDEFGFTFVPGKSFTAK